MPRPVPRLALAVVVAAGLSLGAVACSSSDEDSSPSSTSTTAAPAASSTTLAKPTNPATEEGLTGAATAYLTAGNAGNAVEQYATLSKRCLAEWETAAAWGRNVVQATKILNDLGFSSDGAVVESVTVENFTPEKASVKAVVKTSDGKTIDMLANSEWVYEDGGWRADSCGSAL